MSAQPQRKEQDAGTRSHHLKISLTQAKQHLIDTIRAGLVPLLVGQPGEGKSAMIRQLAKEYGLKLIDLRLAQCDPTDLLGFPHIDKEAGKARYVPMDTFPLEGDKVPDGYNGWLLFLDEFTSADRGVQKAAYKLVLDREVGNQKLHPNVAVVAAGNRMEDNAIVEEIGTALQSRLIHFELESDPKEFLYWMQKNNFDVRITTYLEHKPDHINTFHPDHSDVTFACRRTWDFANQLLKNTTSTGTDLVTLIGGAVTQGIARNLVTFMDVFKDIPKATEIVNRPESTRIPTEPSSLFAVSGSLGVWAEDNTIEPIVKYIRRMPPEFQAVSIRSIFLRKPELEFHEAITDWMADFGDSVW